MAVSEGVCEQRNSAKDRYSSFLNHFSEILSYKNNHPSETI